MSVDAAHIVEADDMASSGWIAQRLSQLRAIIDAFPGISQGMLSLIDQAIVSVTSFASMVIVGRNTSQDELGVYYLILSIVFIVVGIHEQLIAGPYTIYSKRYRDRDLANFAGSAWVHHAVLTIVCTVLLLGAVVSLTAAGWTRMLPGLWVLVAAGPIILLREWIRRFAFANLEIIPAIVLDAVVAVTQLGSLLLLAYFDKLTIPLTFAVMGAACALAILGWFAFGRPKLSFQLSHRETWSQNWLFGRWALQSYLVVSMTSFIMPWILDLAVSTAAAGVFAAANTLINIAYVFLASMDRVLMPRAAEAFTRGHCRALRRALLMGALAILPILAGFCAAFFLLGSHLAVFVYGHDYAGNANLLTTLALAMFVNGIAVICGTGLWAIDQPRVSFVADLASLTVTVIAGLLIVVSWGPLGAAVAILAGTTCGAGLRFIQLVRSLARLESNSGSVGELSDAAAPCPG